MKAKRFLIILVTLTLIAASPAAAQGGAKARFAHVAPGLSAIDISVNGELAAADLSYGEATTFMTVPFGELQLDAHYAGSDSLAFSQTLESDSMSATSFVVYSGAAPAFHGVSENLDALASGKMRLNLLYAIDAGPALDVVVSDTGQSLVEGGLMPGDVLGPYETDAAVFEWAALPAGADMADSILDMRLATIAGASHLVIVHGSESEPQMLDASAATAADADSGVVRFVHAVAGAAPFSVYVDGVLIVPSLRNAAPTPHIPLSQGTHEASFRIGSAEVERLTLTLGAGDARTVVIMGTPAELNTHVYSDDLSLDSRATKMSLINAIPGSVVDRLALSSGGVAAADVAYGQSSGAVIAPGAQGISLHMSIGDESGTVASPPESFYGGSYYNLIALPGSAFAGPKLLFAETSVARGVDAEAADMAGMASDDMAMDGDDAMPASAIAIEDIEGATAVVRLNPGANLQLRQYPHTDALSLGLAPSGALLIVQGRRGITEHYGAEPQDEPVDLSDFDSDPAEGLEWWQDLEAADTWLFVTYPTPDGGAIDAWVHALYLTVTDDVGESQRLASLDMIRQNEAGSARNTAIGPPQPAERVTALVVNLDEGVRLNIRVANSADSENLSQVELGTVLRLAGLDEDDEWAFVEHRATNNVSISGWVSAGFVAPQLDGQPTTLEMLRNRPDALIGVVSDERRGGISVIGDAEAPAAPQQDPFLGVVAGTVLVDPGANLHLRVSPAAFSESLSLLPAGTVMIVNGINELGDWYRVAHEGVDGWVASKFVALSFNGRQLPRASLEARLDRYNALGKRVGDG